MYRYKFSHENIVTRKGVVEQGIYGCVFCVNARFTDKGSRINPTVTFINENGGFYFWKRLVLVMHGVHGRCCSLAVWDGKCRRKMTRVMEGDDVTLMGCWGGDDGKSEKEGGLWRKPRKEDMKKKECKER
jgi:hypothetical protein